MEMTIPVTLIVKAPNQQIEDQTVKCELSWTISRLKGHLSEVYPSKPAQHEQKLIYSGQLLPDSVVLKDVLRNYDGENTHTVHLVCAPSKTKVETPKPKPKMTDTQPPSATPTEAEISPHSSDTGLHQQNVNLNNQETVPDFRTAWASMTQPYSMFTDPNQYAVHAAIMQQAYAQYINQYMQMVTNQRFGEQQREPEGAAQAPELPVAEAAAEEPEGDEPQPDRDWLDWFYVLSRAVLLFSVVYFYSSPLRFALVLVLGIALYLYQTGFFRPPALNNNDAPRPENNNVQPQNADARPSQTNNDQALDQRPTMLNIMWTFFTTFFASLIPEVPNAV